MRPRTDKWWSIDEKTDAASLADEVCASVSGAVVGVLEKCTTREDIISLLDSDVRPPMSDKQRRDLKARLSVL